jgi:hypothetical protein
MMEEHSEFVEVVLPGEDAFNLTMASKTLDQWFKRNPQLVKARDTEKINHCRHLLRDFARFYKGSLLSRDAAALPDELGILPYHAPDAAAYTVCTTQTLESSIDNPTGGVGYVWVYYDVYGEVVGLPLACSEEVPSGPQLEKQEDRDRRETAWLFRLPPRIIKMEDSQ